MRTSIIAVLLVCATASFVFARSGQRVSPTTATLLSAVLPGAGQFYAHDDQKAGLFMGVYVGSLSLALAYGPQAFEKVKHEGEEFADLEDTGSKNTLKTIVYGCYVVAAGTWLWSVLDAPVTARRYNANIVQVHPIISPDRSFAGLSVRVKLR